MLEDGVAYKEIVAALAQLGHTVSPRNISNWYQGGYQDWLLHQERLAANRIREEAVLDILTNNHDVDLPAAGLQVAATHLCQLLLAAHPETADPDSGLDNYIRVANSLCRISRQLMKVQEFRDQYPSDPDNPDDSDTGNPEPEPLSPTELEVQDSEPSVPGSSHSTSTDQPSQNSSFKVQNSEFEVQGSERHPSILHPPLAILNPEAAPNPPIHQSTIRGLPPSAASVVRSPVVP